MEDLIPLDSLKTAHIETSLIGSKAIARVLESLPLTEFLNLAESQVKNITDSMIEDNAKLVQDIAHALETKVSGWLEPKVLCTVQSNIDIHQTFSTFLQLQQTNAL